MYINSIIKSVKILSNVIIQYFHLSKDKCNNTKVIQVICQGIQILSK